MEKAKRYLVFLVGLFITSLGVSLITKASLGTSPISAIPYVLSLRFSWTLGEFTIVFSLLLVALQVVILRRRFRLEHLLQIPVSVAFGYFIDLTMLALGWLNPQACGFKLVAFAVGCVVLGFGIYLEMLANVVMLPGESFVRSIVIVWRRDFGKTKVAFDVSISAAAAVLTLIFFHSLTGVREGTVVAAACVGLLVKLFGRLLPGLEERLFSPAARTEQA